MPNPARNRLLSGGARTFSPLSISGLQLWLKANGTLWQDSARTTPAVADADPVGAWDDASGLGNHALQVTNGKRPLLKLAILNGLPILRTDGIDDHFLVSGLTLTQSMSFFVVVKNSTQSVGGSLQRALLASTVDPYVNSGTGYGFGLKRSGSEGFVAQIPASAAISPQITDSVAADSAFVLFSFVNSANSSQAWRNGVSIGTDATADRVSGFNTGYRVFGETSSTTRYYLGDCAELLAYNSGLSATDRTGVQSYLKAKYNI